MQQSLRFSILLSILAALLTMGLKLLAYWLTGSVGLLSDAAESLVNLTAAFTALACLWYAQRPIDSTHTYGHEKIEYFSCGLEGILIVVAGLGIMWYAVGRLIHPEPLQDLGIGTLIALGASGINFLVGRMLLTVGRKYESIVLEADGHHLMTDVWTSLGVLAGLFFVWLTGWEVLDPLLAIAVAGNILWTAADLLRRSFNGLMDHALPEQEQERIRKAIEENIPSGTHYHALRTRQAGARRFLEFHLLVPGQWSVQKAHNLVDEIEASLRAGFAVLEVTIHLEPIEAKESWQDSELLNFERPRPH